MAEDIRIRFACGHVLDLGGSADVSSVECATCGERRVMSVHAPPPRIRAVNCNGASMGPLVKHV